MQFVVQFSVCDLKTNSLVSQAKKSIWSKKYATTLSLPMILSIILSQQCISLEGIRGIAIVSNISWILRSSLFIWEYWGNLTVVSWIRTTFLFMDSAFSNANLQFSLVRELSDKRNKRTPSLLYKRKVLEFSLLLFMIEIIFYLNPKVGCCRFQRI